MKVVWTKEEMASSVDLFFLYAYWCRSIVIQACHCGRFGDGDDRGGLEAGRDRHLLKRGVEDVCQHLRQLVCAAPQQPPEDVLRTSSWSAAEVFGSSKWA